MRAVLAKNNTDQRETTEELDHAILQIISKAMVSDQVVDIFAAAGEMLDLALSECNRMKNLIRSLRDFYRPSSGEKTFVDVHATIDALLLLCTSDFRRQKMSTVKNYAARLPQVKAFMTRLNKCFLICTPVSLIATATLCFSTAKQMDRPSNIFAKAVDTLGLNDGITDRRMQVVFHSLRHSCASWLVNAGVELPIIAKILGQVSGNDDEVQSCE